MLGQRARSTVSVYAQEHCREPKTGQQKVPFYCEDEIYCRSGYSLSMLDPHSAISLIKRYSLFSAISHLTLPLIERYPLFSVIPYSAFSLI